MPKNDKMILAELVDENKRAAFIKATKDRPWVQKLQLGDKVWMMHGTKPEQATVAIDVYRHQHKWLCGCICPTHGTHMPPVQVVRETEYYPDNGRSRQRKVTVVMVDLRLDVSEEDGTRQFFIENAEKLYQTELEAQQAWVDANYGCGAETIHEKYDHRRNRSVRAGYCSPLEAAQGELEDAKASHLRSIEILQKQLKTERSALAQATKDHTKKVHEVKKNEDRLKKMGVVFPKNMKLDGES